MVAVRDFESDNTKPDEEAVASARPHRFAGAPPVLQPFHQRAAKEPKRDEEQKVH